LLQLEGHAVSLRAQSPPGKAGRAKDHHSNGQPSPGPRPSTSYADGWLDRIPDELKATPQWVVWRYWVRDAKWTKVPFRAADPTTTAKPNDPATWDTFETAAAAYEAWRGRDGGTNSKTSRLDGIGRMFSADDPYCGVDLDDCIDADGLIIPAARRVVERLKTYGDISPSGRGIKFIARAKLPGGGHRKAGVWPGGTGAIEMYDQTRYFTFTGNRLDGHPTTVEDIEAAVLAIHDEFWPPKAKGGNKPAGNPDVWEIPVTSSALPASDDELLTHAYRCKRGAELQSLYLGNVPAGKSMSEATAALLCKLAFWTARDATRMDRMFRASGLMRSKWDEPRGSSTWGATEIESAIELTTDVYSPTPAFTSGPGGMRFTATAYGPSSYRNGKHEPPPNSGPPPEPPQGGADDPGDGPTDAEMGIVDATEIKLENPAWLWGRRFLKGKINLIVGEGGDGKTTIAIMVGSVVTNGGTFPDGQPSGPPGRVLVLAAEDGAGDTIIPRFVAAGADLSFGRIKILTARVNIPKKGDRPAMVHPVCLQDLDYWRWVFERQRPAVIIIDPLPAYLGRGVNDHKNSDVQAALQSFAILANEFGVCVIAITHTGKSTDRKLIHKVLGSVAYTNIARVVHITVCDPENPGARYLQRQKCNLDEPVNALAYKLVSATFDRDGETYQTSRAEFDPEPVAIDAEAMANPKRGGNGEPTRGPDPKKETAAAEWLHDFLDGRDGWTEQRAIRQAAGDKGIIGHKNEVTQKWSNLKMLYRAKDRVPELALPRAGKRVDEQDMKSDRDKYPRVCWRLIDADAAF
jgi:putative DNA primase/helicase